MKTINKEVSDALHMLFHCSLKDTEYTTQREQFREVYLYIEKLEDNWNELKKWLEEEIEHNVDGIKSFGGYQCKRTLDKMQELEGNNE